ncbi:hypothetical protein NL676_019996 [Syzygium grande]|nr:hypothetical protein NL676_019996 [Syzygium grande]
MGSLGPHRPLPNCYPLLNLAPKRSGKAPVAVKKKQEKVVNPLFKKRPKQFGIGSTLPPKRDLTRFVKFPKTVQIQRKRRILKQRLKENGNSILYREGQARLGTIVHKKTASVLCLNTVKNEDKLEFSKILEAIKANFNDKYDEHSKKWVVGSWAQNPKPKPRPKKGFLPRKLLRE